MARLWHSGWELNTNTTGLEWDSATGAPTRSTTTIRSGTYSGRISSLVSATVKGWRWQFASANGNGPYFFRFYFNYATVPSAENRIFILADSSAGFDTTTPKVYLTFDNTGALRLYDEDGAIGSASSALSSGTWYRIEVKFDRTAAAGSHVVEAQIDGTVFATSSARNIAAGIQGINIGGNMAVEAQTTGDWFFDDLAINDSTGSFQTTYPGSAKIIHLKPSAAGDANSFAVQVGGTAGSGNNFTRVKENTPDDATTYNGSAVLNQEDLFNCDDSGIGASDNVQVVAVGVRMADLVGADATAAFKLEIIKTSGGTKTQSADLIPNSTAWLTNAAAVPKNYPLVTYQDPDGNNWTQTTLDSMQIGYLLDAINVQTIAISAVWASVEYTPATNTGGTLPLMGVG